MVSGWLICKSSNSWIPSNEMLNYSTRQVICSQTTSPVRTADYKGSFNGHFTTQGCIMKFMFVAPFCYAHTHTHKKNTEQNLIKNYSFWWRAMDEFKSLSLRKEAALESGGTAADTFMPLVCLTSSIPLTVLINVNSSAVFKKQISKLIKSGFEDNT